MRFFPSIAVVQNLTGATTSKDHPLKQQFSKDIGGSVRVKCPGDVEEVVKYLTERKKPNMSRADAQVKAASKSCARYVRTFSPPKEVMKAKLIGNFNRYVVIDKKIVRGRGLPLLNPEVPKGKSGPQGAQTALNNLVSCIDKDCCQDPYDLGGM